MRTFASTFLLISASLFAQRPTFNFVSPTINGKIVLPPQSGTWEPSVAALYDEGTRPVLQYHDKERDINLSAILFPSERGNATAESCRDSLMPGLMSALKDHGAVLAAESKSASKGANGIETAETRYTIAKQGTFALNQRNIFVFAGSDHTCAEIHVSKVTAKPVDEDVLANIANSFTTELTYKAKPEDYETMGVIFFEGAKNYVASAIFYQRAYDTMSSDEHKMRMGRYVADQLTMAYGMSGDLPRSRATAEAAIALDPSYPLYYYNLACADAESGDARSAATHLQQAFDRRANTLQGESFPDPTKDDSLQKLKSDSQFWALANKIRAQINR